MIRTSLLMKNTKQVILEKARQLFNMHGYSRVTIRMVAQELGMSSGNLNYHFKRREDILEALYFEMVAVLDARLEAIPNTEYNLSVMLNGMRVSMSKMVDYKFFWSDMYYILQQHDTIRKHFDASIKKEFESWHLIFYKMQSNGLMKSESFTGEYDQLVQRMIDFANTWIYASVLYKTKRLTKAFIHQQADYLLTLLFPYLTDKGQKAFKLLMNA